MKATKSHLCYRVGILSEILCHSVSRRMEHNTFALRTRPHAPENPFFDARMADLSKNIVRTSPCWQTRERPRGRSPPIATQDLEAYMQNQSIDGNYNNNNVDLGA